MYSEHGFEPLIRPVLAELEPVSETVVAEVSEPALPQVPKLVRPRELEQMIGDTVYREKLVWAVNAAAKEHAVDPWLIWTVVKFEGTYQHFKGTRVKRGNAREVGVAQIQPYWGRKFGHDLFDLRDNIRCCAELLAFAKYERGYDTLLTLGWYNTGKEVVNAYARRGHKQYHTWLAMEG